MTESEHHRVAIIGAGFSGLGMAIRLRQEGIDDFVVSIQTEDGARRTFRRDGANPKVDLNDPLEPHRRLVHLVVFPVGKLLNTGWRPIGRTLVPVSNIDVKLTLREGERVREVRVASTEATLPLQGTNGIAHVVVPHVADHEIVIFELESD